MSGNMRLYFLAVFLCSGTLLFAAGCTFILGSNNAPERSGPCQVNLLGHCETSKNDVEVDKTKNAEGGDVTKTIDFEASQRGLTIGGD